MAKVKCVVCANESSGLCKIKKCKVSLNKSRNCDAYVYDERKFKEKKKVPIIRAPFKEQQLAKEAWKKARKELKELKDQKPSEGTAKKLGLLSENTKEMGNKKEDLNRLPRGMNDTIGINYADKINDPKKLKHPLTGDLSRFTTTARKKGNDDNED